MAGDLDPHVLRAVVSLCELNPPAPSGGLGVLNEVPVGHSGQKPCQNAGQAVFWLQPCRLPAVAVGAGEV